VASNWSLVVRAILANYIRPAAAVGLLLLFHANPWSRLSLVAGLSELQTTSDSDGQRGCAGIK
jgi:hypothetical protein